MLARAFSFVVTASSLIGAPPPVPLEPIPEPFGSRWSLSGHIRYIRLGTRTTVTLGSATKSSLLVQEFSGLGVHRRGQFLKQRPIYLTRSEERRVGKECRSRWSPYH